jgi:DNA/RNA endonuclease YhcR with UshA esterase domain
MRAAVAPVTHIRSLRHAQQEIAVTKIVWIWGGSRAKFGAPEETYRNKNICVTGRIESYRGEPEIIASDPAQLSTDSR